MGIDMNKAFPTKYVSAGELGQKDHTLTITRVEMETIGQDDRKPVVYFANANKGLVLNKTNNNTIMTMYGRDSDGWINKQITIGATWVEFRGDQVLGIRVRPGMNQTANAPAPTPTETDATFSGQPSDLNSDLDDSIPF